MKEWDWYIYAIPSYANYMQPLSNITSYKTVEWLILQDYAREHTFMIRSIH